MVKTERRSGKRRELTYNQENQVEISTKTISVICKLIRRVGLDFKKIGRALYIGESRAHQIVCEIEAFDYTIIERATKDFLRTRRGRRILKEPKEIMPLEYYLTKF